LNINDKNRETMKKLSLIIALIAITFAVAAQEDQTGSTLGQPIRPRVVRPWTSDDMGEFSTPVSYVHQREADVMYYVTIWRTIDLREKLNHPLYFPTSPKGKGALRSLGQVIFDALDFNNPENETALRVYTDEECQYPKTKDEIRDVLVRRYSTPKVDEDGNEIGMDDMEEEFTSDKILCYFIKEVWFFDRERSLLDVRILEIEPIVEYTPELNLGADAENLSEDMVENRKQLKRIGYIMYDELRPYLAKQEVFNIKNNAARISFDDLLTWKRQFASYIRAEENVYDDREINAYIANPRDQRIESEKIKESIRTMEHDLWEF
jgi:gliding motility associated protien GldN